MSEPSNWMLVFSDGTGQRGVRDDDTVKNTNVFQMFMASEGKPYLETFYDPGLGAPAEGMNGPVRYLRNLWAKSTGYGITANITDCYEALLRQWRPGMKIGLFGFSRGAYTVRCLGGVLATCGLATTDGGKPISTDEKGRGAARRRAIATAAVEAYKIKAAAERRAAATAFVAKHAALPVTPDVIGVFDTVKSLGLPGIAGLVNPWQHAFHDTELSVRVPVGLHALSIDENRKSFLPVLWDEVDESSKAAGQVVEQVWFPGAHSDVGGGYADDWRLADLSLDWMLDRLRNVAQLHIPLTVVMRDNMLGKAHDERTGFGVFWRSAERTIRAEAIDVDALARDIEIRFERGMPRYRPSGLGGHPRVERYFLQRRGKYGQG